VGKYSETMKRMPSRSEELIPSVGRQRDGAVVDLEELKDRARQRDGSVAKLDEVAWPRPIESINVPEPRIGSTSPLVPVPAPQEITGVIASSPSIRQLSERLAPSASVDKSCRLAIGGCRQQDGASSVAAAIAFDLSQRLSINTVLVDANLRNPSLHRLLAPGDRRNSQMLLDGALQVRNTGWRRLSLVSCALQNDDGLRDQMIAKLETLLSTFSAVVIDLGVTRLDARMLPLVRPTDPILLVVRSGQTERQELVTTTAALRAADRTVAGVILNGATSTVANFLGR
jgi:Mrp family chromosome partitioning ATPase